MMFDLTDKVALVTGASSGIGKAIAHEMASAGARVVVCGIDAPGCDVVVGELRERGREAMAIRCDVSDRVGLRSLVDAVIGRWGHIDILVCNAGVAPHVGPIAEASDADWERTLTVNVRSALWLTSMVIPAMALRRDGSVILISSIAGIRGNKSLGLYGLSKAALAQLARNLAVEWGPSNVRVNAIAPGLIRTDLARPVLDADEILQRRIEMTPLRRSGEPHEVAAVALLLASPAGAFITGQNLIVDGGTTIGDGN